MVLNILALLLSLSSCGPKHHSKPAQADSRLADLETLYAANLEQARSVHSPDGWLDAKDCDAALWNYSYGSAKGVVGFHPEAAEYSDHPGKYSRRPFPACWAPEGGDMGSKTTWSRDQAISGLFPYMFLTRNVVMLEQHIQYGEEQNWQMGEPLADGRVIYTPQMIGLLYKMRHALTGETSAQENWPEIFPAGLGDDYEGHLQVKTIWLTGEIANALHDHSAIPQKSASLLDIPDSAYQRLQEHAASGSDPFFTYVLGKYDGSMSRTLDILLDPTMPMGTFVRAGADGNLDQIRLAHWLFVASLTLEALK